MQSLPSIAELASVLHISEPACRLVIALFINYPVVLIFRCLVFKRTESIQHLYIISSGLGLAYFTFGDDVIHSIATVFLNYVLLATIGGSFTSVVIAFVFNSVYLIVGYWHVYDGPYDITWLTPQCVLTLKMIGVAFDVYDGRRASTDALSADQKELKLDKPPSFLALCGFAYFCGGFLTGPQFSMRRYLELTSGRLSSSWGSIPAGLKRFLVGIVYCALLANVSAVYPRNYPLSAEFQDSPFVYKLFAMCLWGEFILWKYVSVWLLAEGSCIVSGLTYNGQDDLGRPRWDACSNVHLIDLETAVSLKDVVRSFNCNTNIWVARYVYKRLKFAGSKLISQTCSLVFLAVWHGLYMGYYICFVLEFVLMMCEAQVQALARGTGLSAITSHPIARVPVLIVRRFAVLLIMAYALTAFVFLRREPIHKVYASMYYFGHYAIAVFLLVNYLILKPYLRRRLDTVKSSTDAKLKSS